MRGLKRLGADHDDAAVRCVFARTATQPPNDAVESPDDFLQHCDTGYAKWHRLEEILGKMKVLVQEGHYLSESIDMRIHRGGRELVDDICVWREDLEYLIDYLEGFFIWEENYRVFECDIIDVQHQHDQYALGLARLREAVDAAAA